MMYFYLRPQPGDSFVGKAISPTIPVISNRCNHTCHLEQLQPYLSSRTAVCERSYALTTQDFSVVEMTVSTISNSTFTVRTKRNTAMAKANVSNKNRSQRIENRRIGVKYHINSLRFCNNPLLYVKTDPLTS